MAFCTLVDTYAFLSLLTMCCTLVGTCAQTPCPLSLLGQLPCAGHLSERWPPSISLSSARPPCPVPWSGDVLKPRAPFTCRINSPALVTRLNDGPAQHIIISSFDGFLYLIDGMTACADTVDIGETSYRCVAWFIPDFL